MAKKSKEKIDKKAGAIQKKEDARLEEASKERALKEGIEREKVIEARVKAIEGLKARIKELDDLYKVLKAEGINSISDLEIKLARAGQDLVVEEKKVV